MREDEHEHKNVVHAQRVFDQVTSKKIEPVMRALNTPDDGVEAERHHDPDPASSRRSGHAQCSAAAMKREEVDANRDEHANVKGDPKPDARRHGGQTFTPEGSRQLRSIREQVANCATRRWDLYVT